MNVTNVLTTAFYLGFGLAVFGVPYALLVAGVSAIVLGVIYLVNLIKTA